MKVLILGHTGFLGSNLLKRIDQELHEVSVASKSSGIDFRNYAEFENLIVDNGPDIVVNCAAHVGGIQYGIKHGAKIYNDNLQMTLNLYRLAEKHKFSVINPISNCIYPFDATILKEEDIWKGEVDKSVLSYASVRRMTLIGAEVYWEESNVQSLNLIFPNMYGEGDHLDPIRSHAVGGLIYRFFLAKNSGTNSIQIWGSGNPIREWMYVGDAAEIMIRAIDTNFTCETLNIGIGKGISVADLAFKIRDVVGFEGEIIFKPEFPDGAACKIMDNSKSIGSFAEYRKLNLTQGLERTAKWYEQEMIKVGVL